jgi:hypothetical protein
VVEVVVEVVVKAKVVNLDSVVADEQQPKNLKNIENMEKLEREKYDKNFNILPLLSIV